MKTHLKSYHINHKAVCGKDEINNNNIILSDEVSIITCKSCLNYILKIKKLGKILGKNMYPEIYDKIQKCKRFKK
jgi:hypothetical protein